MTDREALAALDQAARLVFEWRKGADVQDLILDMERVRQDVGLRSEPRQPTLDEGLREALTEKGRKAEVEAAWNDGFAQGMALTRSEATAIERMPWNPTMEEPNPAAEVAVEEFRSAVLAALAPTTGHAPWRNASVEDWDRPAAQERETPT